MFYVAHFSIKNINRSVTQLLTVALTCSCVGNQLQSPALYHLAEKDESSLEYSSLHNLKAGLHFLSIHNFSFSVGCTHTNFPLEKLVLLERLMVEQW